MKSTKKEAAAKANSSENKEQAERIDLGVKFVDQMLGVMDKLQKSFDANITKNEEHNNEQKENLTKIENKLNEKLNEMHEEITYIKDELVSVKDEVSCIVRYLNGDYQHYKHDNDSNG